MRRGSSPAAAETKDIHATENRGAMISQSEPHAVDLLRLVDVLFQRKNSSILALEDQGRQGEIYFSAGEIVHASCAGKQAESALLELLSWRTGTLRLAPMQTPPERSLEVDAETIISLRAAGGGGAEMGSVS